MVPQHAADLIPPNIADKTQYAPRNIRDLRKHIYLHYSFSKILYSFSTFKKLISSRFPLPPVTSETTVFFYQLCMPGSGINAVD